MVRAAGYRARIPRQARGGTLAAACGMPRGRRAAAVRPERRAALQVGRVGPPMTLWAPSLTYASVEQLAVATDINYTARMVPELRNALEAGANVVEAQLHRRFAPWSGTRYFDFPTRD